MIVWVTDRLVRVWSMGSVVVVVADWLGLANTPFHLQLNQSIHFDGVFHR